MSEGVNHLRVTRHDCNANLRSVSHFLYTKHLQRWPVDIYVLLCARKTIFTSTFRSTRNIYPLGLESTLFRTKECVATAPVEHKFRNDILDPKM